MVRLCRVLASAWLLALGCAGAELRPETSAAFDRYILHAEARVAAQVKSDPGFLWADTAGRRAGLRRGEVASEARIARGELKVAGGLIHDWIGAVYIPGVSIAEVVALLQNYDNHKNVYAPEVIDSRVLFRHDNDFRVALRLLKRKVITVVLNTEHEVHYQQLTPTRWQSRSASTRIAEVHEPGRRNERDLPPGTGHGFLWRLNTYWTMQERDAGAYVECEAISLSRDVPKGLAWLIEPIVRTLPRESLGNTLRATRSALMKARLPVRVSRFSRHLLAIDLRFRDDFVTFAPLESIWLAGNRHANPAP